MSTSWQTLASQKRASLLALIPAEWRIDPIPSVDELPDGTAYVEGLLSEEEVLYTRASADEIARRVGEGEWKAEGVTRAFCKRAAFGGQLVGFDDDFIFPHKYSSGMYI